MVSIRGKENKNPWGGKKNKQTQTFKSTTKKLQNRSPTYIPNARPQQAQAAPCHPCTTWHRGSPELFALCSFLCMLCSRPMGPQPAPLQWEGCAGLPVPPPARGVGSSVLTGMGAASGTGWHRQPRGSMAGRGAAAPGMGTSGLWGDHNSAAGGGEDEEGEERTAGRGGRLALETSCPGGCALRCSSGGNEPLQGSDRPCMPSPQGRVSRSPARESSPSGGSFPLNL